MTWHGMRDDARNVGARHCPHLSPESVKEDVLLLAGVERSGGQLRRTTQPRVRIDATAVACGSPGRWRCRGAAQSPCGSSPRAMKAITSCSRCVTYTASRAAAASARTAAHAIWENTVPVIEGGNTRAPISRLSRKHASGVARHCECGAIELGLGSEETARDESRGALTSHYSLRILIQDRGSRFTGSKPALMCAKSPTA